jgi:hypothetical protein
MDTTSFPAVDNFVPPPFTGKAKSWANPVSLAVFAVVAEQPVVSLSKSPTTRVKRNPGGAASPRQGWKSPKQLEDGDASPNPSPRNKSPRAAATTTNESPEAKVRENVVLEPAPAPPRAKQAQFPPVPKRPAAPPAPSHQPRVEDDTTNLSVYEDPPLPDAAAEEARREELHRLSLLLNAKEREEMFAREEAKRLEEERRQERENERRRQEEEERRRQEEEERRRVEEEERRRTELAKRAPPVAKAPPSPSFRQHKAPEAKPVQAAPVKSEDKICSVCDSASPSSETFCVECGSKL